MLSFSQARQGYSFNCGIRNLSPKTTAWYDTLLTAFERFLQDRSPQPLALEKITRADVEQFIAGLQSRQVQFEHHPHHKPVQKPLSAFTVHGYVRTLSAFFHWAHDQGMIESNPMASIRRPKLPQIVKPRFSEQEIQRLLKTCDQYPASLAARNRAMILLLLDTGVRADELCHLTLTDLDPQYRRASVVGKGLKTRFVPLGARVRQALWSYITVHRPAPRNTNAVFLSNWGNSLDPNKLAHILKALGRRAGVEDCHAHKFRHTCARLATRNGMGVLHLQQLLGHETLAVTQIYARLERQDLEESHERCSPADNLPL